MDYNRQKLSKKILFSGERVKEYFHRNGISYKVAAEKLGIDKNTVAKLVNGGNMNVDIVLKFCNTFGLDIADFFKCEIIDETGKARIYFLSTIISLTDENRVSEDSFKYKKCEYGSVSLDELLSMIEQNNCILNKLIEERKSLSE